VTRPGLWPALLQPALSRLQIFLHPRHKPQQPNSQQVLHVSGMASSPRHTITYPEHSAEVYSSTAFVLFSPRSLHIQQSFQSVFERYLGKLRMCQDAPQWIDLQRWCQYSHKACPKCAHNNKARRCDHTLLPLQHTVSHSCIHANWRPFTHILQIENTTQQSNAGAADGISRSSTLHAPCHTALLPPELSRLQCTVLTTEPPGGPDGCAQSECHRPARSSAHERRFTCSHIPDVCVYFRLPSFAPSSISDFALRCAD